MCYIYSEEDKFSDPCPECGTQLIAHMSGVSCPNLECDYWFCY